MTEDLIIEVTRVNRHYPENQRISQWEFNVENDNLDKTNEKKLQTALNLRQLPLFSRKLTTGSKGIDQILDGGIPLFGITQISGESSCGKTQIALQLAITCQYSHEIGGLDSGAIYICTEDIFPANRLAELIRLNGGLSDNILVKHIYDGNQLLNCLIYELPKLLTNIRLLIIDSIAGPFRFDSDEVTDKYKTIEETGKALQNLWKNFGVAIICINQVTTQISNCSKIVPALGVTWSGFVTTNIVLTRDRDAGSRTCSIIGSPHLPNQSCTYTITEQGVR